MERRIRLANSTPDVKTLLQNSSYVYSKGDSEDMDENALAARFSGMGLQRPGSGEYLPPPSAALVSVMYFACSFLKAQSIIYRVGLA
jgi:hypothetical protein